MLDFFEISMVGCSRGRKPLSLSITGRSTALISTSTFARVETPLIGSQPILFYHHHRRTRDVVIR